MLKQLLGKFILALRGWKLDFEEDTLRKARHSVVVSAPHTSNWDFFYAIAVFWVMDLDVKYFIKDTYTKSPIGWFFKWTGAVGVDRKKHNNLVDFSIAQLHEHNPLAIIVPAEGTRRRVEKWKTGFYHIALGAGVPISLGYMDYKRRIAGIREVYMPTGNFEKDMTHFEDFFKTITPKHPENYNPKIF